LRSLERSPDPLAGFKRFTSKRREGRKGRRDEEERRKGEGREEKEGSQ